MWRKTSNSLSVQKKLKADICDVYTFGFWVMANTVYSISGNIDIVVMINNDKVRLQRFKWRILTQRLRYQLKIFISKKNPNQIQKRKFTYVFIKLTYNFGPNIVLMDFLTHLQLQKKTFRCGHSFLDSIHIEPISNRSLDYLLF